MSTAQPQSGLVLAARYAVPFVLLVIPVWMSRVSAVVTEPYLDEAFHVPQAQAYWHHQWTHWDPKITTPPGLYIWSYVLCIVALTLRDSPKELHPEALRATNVAAAAVFLPWRLQTLLDTLRKERNTRPSGAWLSHTVLNICLFPPLFFFSGLYYTDILALLAVVEAYNWDLKRATSLTTVPSRTVIFLLLGLVALVCRQTNIFWVAVFFGGLQVVRTVSQSAKICRSKNAVDIFRGGLRNELYDPFVADASITDYFKAAISLAAAAFGNLGQVVRSLLVYLLILAAFGGFVLWNGGVVLGHKEFHTAGLHLPQMLYIWPYFLFFSWPILVTPVINLLLPRSYLPRFMDYGFAAKQKGLPKILTALAVIPLMAAVVHFNTIVHPFTLADNRHYVFYAFRILRSHEAIKYAATVIYFLGAWATISAFGFSTTSTPRRLGSVPQSAPQPAPAAPPQTRKQARDAKFRHKESKHKPSKTAPQPPKPKPLNEEEFEKLKEAISQRQRQQQGAPRVSFVLVWLAATALSLITAPLVEPRYFIIPWVIWRLHLPRQPVPQAYRERPSNEKEALHAAIATNFPLFLETAWFMLVNAVTGYVFLYKGFEWPQEPGKVQRFMCTAVLASLHRSITPPSPRAQRRSAPSSTGVKNAQQNRVRVIASPFRLTHVRDLAESSGNNVDTVRLRDILGDPMIRECWQFNYLFDVDFLMQQFDEDVRSLVTVKVVHGSWKREAPNRIRIDEACSRYPNVEAVVAYMPEAFGTHHSKMMILLRHDDLAQVIIHTANMIPGDWANMCQAVWQSPLLPLQNDSSAEPGHAAMGTGVRFKRDLLAYLAHYGTKKTGPLVDQLRRYEFGAVRAALVASVPSKQKFSDAADSQRATLWGWPALRDVVRSIPLRADGRSKSTATPHVVTQISSVASLGQTDKWLKDVLFKSLSSDPATNYSIIFPTDDEIRRSLNGYGSGGSIHMKIQSAPQQKQLQYMRQYLCHWAGDRDDSSRSDLSTSSKRDAGRRRAAPHIKTYTRFSDAKTMDSVDWTMVTSANLSTQAWGAAPNASGEVRICSYEIGVLVWPQLFAGDEVERAVMVPCFKRDTPDVSESEGAVPSVKIGLRMAYDIPLTPYTREDAPWCATATHTEPDWLGQTWTDDS
ncbi:tyrosyl-DNA phosphodiesterase-domain-containing protein [Aspergillus ambiguus]|uniref:dolichyl-P-Glc:Glc(2)Man(9)GlcNAc(2)-PP-dolichol alpha-1,2- glucosyltransferase n=1 Tax=Aspergillus ambiguus TaxID=176160 RepID=UPI003CCE1D92